MPTGTVQRLMADKGFGFILRDGAKRGAKGDVFFHRSACPDYHQLREGSRVTFEEEPSDRGPRAANVELA